MTFSIDVSCFPDGYVTLIAHSVLQSVFSGSPNFPCFTGTAEDLKGRARSHPYQLKHRLFGLKDIAVSNLEVRK